MIKKLDLRIKRQEEDIQEKGAEIERLKTQLEKKGSLPAKEGTFLQD
jgi:hypothetical protein